MRTFTLDEIASYYKELNKNLHEQTNTRVFHPPYRIHVKDENLVIEIVIPGIEKENISLDLNGDVLTVACNYEKDMTIKYSSDTFEYGKVKLNFDVGHSTEEDIHAKLKNGILTITISQKKRAFGKINIG